MYVGIIVNYNPNWLGKKSLFVSCSIRWIKIGRYGWIFCEIALQIGKTIKWAKWVSKLRNGWDFLIWLFWPSRFQSTFWIFCEILHFHFQCHFCSFTFINDAVRTCRRVFPKNSRQTSINRISRLSVCLFCFLFCCCCCLHHCWQFLSIKIWIKIIAVQLICRDLQCKCPSLCHHIQIWSDRLSDVLRIYYHRRIILHHLICLPFDYTITIYRVWIRFELRTQTCWSVCAVRFCTVSNNKWNILFSLNVRSNRLQSQAN